MPRIEFIVLPLAIATAMVGCASQSGSVPASDPDPVVPCAARAAQSDTTPWREARGKGFTFCVPGDWRASGPYTWRGNGGQVTWGLGDGPRVPVTVRPMGSGRVSLPAPGVAWEATETIGGQTVRLMSMRSGSDYLTSATWTSALLSFSGSAQSARDAERQLEIYRTVRVR